MEVICTKTEAFLHSFDVPDFLKTHRHRWRPVLYVCLRHKDQVDKLTMKVYQETKSTHTRRGHLALNEYCNMS